VTDLQALCDLRWLLLSPPLLDSRHARFSGQVFEFTLQQRQQIELWLCQLERRPELLMQWLANSSQKHLARLGRYAEQLLEFFLRFGPTHFLVAANIALRADANARKGDHTTVGEIDYLLKDQEGGVWHWELAVKYFLCRDCDQPTTADLIGPDAVESFDHKLDKLFLRQLRHSAPAAYAQECWQPAAFTRGWIFYPHARPHLTVEQLSHHHLRGTWLTLEQLQQLSEKPPFVAEQFVILDRQRWLSTTLYPSVDPIAQPLLNARALAQAIEARWLGPFVSGVLVAQMQLNEDHMAEVHRFFVVPNVWPEKPPEKPH
jgi:uncharacterized protein